jgi:hypothetical protein
MEMWVILPGKYVRGHQDFCSIAQGKQWWRQGKDRDKKLAIGDFKSLELDTTQKITGLWMQEVYALLSMLKVSQAEFSVSQQ